MFYRLTKPLFVSILLITGGIARSAWRRYLIYSEADFEVYRLAGATGCTDASQIWRGGGDLRSPPPRQISLPSAQRLGQRTPKLKFLLRFDQNMEYKRPDFHNICRICRPTLFQDALSVNTPLPSNRHHRRCGDCLEGKGENYQVCSVQYCVQQLCTVRCTHI